MIWLDYYPRKWKQAYGILLEKEGNRDLTLVISYKIINLLNFIVKLVEKVIVEQLSQFSKNILKLHQGHMGVWKERCTIDMVVSLIYEVEQ